MNDDDLPLSLFEVECDGSACGSGPVGWHIHHRQDGGEPVGRARVTNGVRTAPTLPGPDSERTSHG